MLQELKSFANRYENTARICRYSTHDIVKLNQTLVFIWFALAKVVNMLCGKEGRTTRYKRQTRGTAAVASDTPHQT